MLQSNWSSLYGILLALAILSLVLISGCVATVQDKGTPTTMMIRDKGQGTSYTDSSLSVWFQKSATIYHVPLNHPERESIRKMVEASKTNNSVLCVVFLLQTMHITTVTDCSAPPSQ